MRLNKKNKCGFVGPVSLAAVAGVIALGAVYPQVASSKTFALNNTNENENVPVTVTVNGAVSDSPTTSSDESTNISFSVSQTNNEYDENAVETAEGQADIEFKVTEGAETQEFSNSTEVEFKVQGAAENITEEKSFDISYTVDEWISITTPTAIETSVSPGAGDGTFEAAAQDFAVAGNSAGGISVYVYTNDADGTSLKGAEASNTFSIPTLDALLPTDQGKTASQFSPNKWGYNVSLKSDTTDPADKAYRNLTLPGGAYENVMTDGPVANLPLTLTCGAKVSTAAPSDTYSTSMLLSAVARPENLVNLLP